MRCILLSACIEGVPTTMIKEVKECDLEKWLYDHPKVISEKLKKLKNNRNSEYDMAVLKRLEESIHELGNNHISKDSSRPVFEVVEAVIPYIPDAIVTRVNNTLSMEKAKVKKEKDETTKSIEHAVGSDEIGTMRNQLKHFEDVGSAHWEGVLKNRIHQKYQHLLNELANFCDGPFPPLETLGNYMKEFGDDVLKDVRGHFESWVSSKLQKPFNNRCDTLIQIFSKGLSQSEIDDAQRAITQIYAISSSVARRDLSEGNCVVFFPNYKKYVKEFEDKAVEVLAKNKKEIENGVDEFLKQHSTNGLIKAYGQVKIWDGLVKMLEKEQDTKVIFDMSSYIF